MNPKRTRTIVLLFSGLLDSFFGGILLLTWLGILPINLGDFYIPRSVIGGVGWVLAISGTIMVVYQLTKLKEPEE